MNRRKFLVFSLAPVLAGTLFLSRAPGQNVLYTFQGGAPGDQFGTSVAAFGDMNFDGIPDFVVGAPFKDTNAGDAGAAAVFDGFSGGLFQFPFEQNPNQHFGTSVAGVGDVDGDNIDDFIVGAPQAPGGIPLFGTATVYSGVGSGVLFLFFGDNWFDQMGQSVAGAGDVNGDGTPDFLVGIYADDDNGQDSGSARVYSGSDGSILLDLDGAGAFDRFGWSVASAGDVNNDGTPDVIVGAPQTNQGLPGYARVHSGLNGSVLHTFTGDSADDAFGWSVAGAGDVNLDGFDDLIVGGPRDFLVFTGNGYARVFSGANGSVLFNFAGDAVKDHMGWSVAGAGDVDGDGFPDLIGGAIGMDGGGNGSGAARIFSGQDGSTLFTYDGDAAFDRFGWSVAGAGDVNLDGFADVAVGAPSGSGVAPGSGIVKVISGAPIPPCPGSFQPYGSGLAGSGGHVPVLYGVDCPEIGTLAVGIIQNGKGGFPPGALFVGLSSTSLPAVGGTLLVNPVIFLNSSLFGANVPGVGTSNLLLPIPGNPVLIGLDLFFQAAYLDPGAVQGVSLTNGLQMTIG